MVKRYTPLDKEFYLSQQALLFIRQGLDFEILEVSIAADRRPVVQFSIKDPRGLPLDRDGVFTPGPVSTTFVIGRIPQGEIQYLSYDSSFVTSLITGDTAEQATSDSEGTYAKVEDGVYTYTFGTALSADYDVNVTHTIAAYARRDLREFNLDRYVDNDVTHFVPSGAGVPLPANLLATSAPREFFSPLQPIAAACLSWHDSESSAAHAFTTTSPFGEACAACHGTTADFSVERVHAR